MVVLNNQELIRALTRWVVQQRDPYSKPEHHPERVIRLASTSPGVWLEIRHVQTRRVEISCIHVIHTSHEDSNKSGLRRESRQFNLLMERVRLPVIIWEDRDKEEFQLRWQETLNSGTDLKHILHLLEQSLYLANALQSRLGWVLKSQTQALLH